MSYILFPIDLRLVDSVKNTIRAFEEFCSSHISDTEEDASVCVGVELSYEGSPHLLFELLSALREVCDIITWVSPELSNKALLYSNDSTLSGYYIAERYATFTPSFQKVDHESLWSALLSDTHIIRVYTNNIEVDLNRLHIRSAGNHELLEQYIHAIADSGSPVLLKESMPMPEIAWVFIICINSIQQVRYE